MSCPIYIIVLRSLIEILSFLTVKKDKADLSIFTKSNSLSLQPC